MCRSGTPQPLESLLLTLMELKKTWNGRFINSQSTTPTLQLQICIDSLWEDMAFPRPWYRASWRTNPNVVGLAGVRPWWLFLPGQSEAWFNIEFLLWPGVFFSRQHLSALNRSTHLDWRTGRTQVIPWQPFHPSHVTQPLPLLSQFLNKST